MRLDKGISNRINCKSHSDLCVVNEIHVKKQVKHLFMHSGFYQVSCEESLQN